MIGVFLAGLADLVAAVWTWALLVVAAVLYGGGMFVWGWRRCQYVRGRAEVLAAIELAVSETVVIPRPRQDADQ